MNCKNCKWLSGDFICASPYSDWCGLNVYPFMWCKSWEEDKSKIEIYDFKPKHYLFCVDETENLSDDWIK